MHLVREVHVHGAAIDQELPGAWHYAPPGNGLLAAAGAECVTGHHRPARRGLGRGACRFAGLGGVLREVLGVVVDLIARAGLRRDSGLSHSVFLVLPDRLVLSSCLAGRLLSCPPGPAGAPGAAGARLLRDLRAPERDWPLRPMRMLRA